MVQTMFYISEAAREVKVENHVLRYWEEELNLPVKRNEQGMILNVLFTSKN